MNKEYKLFKKECKSFMNLYNNELENALKIAGDQKRVLSIYYSKYKNSLIENERILVKLNCINHFFKDMEDLRSLDASLSEPAAFKKTFEVSGVPCNEENIKHVAKHKALQDILKSIMEKEKIMNGNHETEKTVDSKYWIGTEETEFVQLIYALVEAGRLRRKNKTIMVMKIATFLGIELSKNWDSNLSKSKNERNYDYKPAIFEDLLQGWKRYENQKGRKR